jgi:hypothetical protein
MQTKRSMFMFLITLFLKREVERSGGRIWGIFQKGKLIPSGGWYVCSQRVDKTQQVTRSTIYILLLSIYAL